MSMSVIRASTVPIDKCLSFKNRKKLACLELNSVKFAITISDVEVET